MKIQNKETTKLPKIKPKQIQIIQNLLKFRFLTTNQVQKLLDHKEPKHAQEWLKDLLDKKYIKRVYDPKNFEENTRPAIYFLAPLSRSLLKSEVDADSLEYIYKEHTRQDKFIYHCLSVADVYLYLLSQKNINEELNFFSKFELLKYEYFPDPLPDAFIAVKGETNTRRYFLDYFDEYTPSWVFRLRVRKYLEYADKNDWDENTDFTPLPNILFVCPNENSKRHIQLYSKALLEKTFEDKVALFLTTRSKLQFGGKNNIWQKV